MVFQSFQFDNLSIKVHCIVAVWLVNPGVCTEVGLLNAQPAGNGCKYLEAVCRVNSPLGSSLCIFSPEQCSITKHRWCLCSCRCRRLEQDVKKLKADLQASRQVEQDLRSQIGSLGSTERSIRSELSQLRQENELLQNK